MTIDILPWLIHGPLLIFIYYKLRQGSLKEPLHSFFDLAILIKILAGIGLGLLYKYYYKEGDTFYLFDVAKKLCDQLINHPDKFGKIFIKGSEELDEPSLNFLRDKPRVFFFIKILTFFSILTFNNYWVTCIYFSLFCFAGMWLLANTIIKYYSVPPLASAISFLFFPSVVFWSSGVTKESLFMGGLGFFLSAIFSCIHAQKFSLKNIVLITFMIYLTASLKYFYLAVLIPVLIAYMIVYFLERRYKKLASSFLLQVLIYFGMFFLIISLAGFFHPLLKPEIFFKFLLRNYHQMLARSHGENVFYFPGLEQNVNSFVSNSPRSLLIGLFRPFIWEVHFNVLEIIAGMENLFLLSMTLWTLVSKSNFRRFKIDGLACVTYVVMLAIIIPLAAPNWGALLRYKVGYLPFLLLLVLSSNAIIYFFQKKILTGIHLKN